MPASLTHRLKQIVPPQGKQWAGYGLRSAGRLTAAVRPLPDFLIVGTKRGGTTSLWNWLLQHPGVLPMFPSAENLKSPHYFYWHYHRGPNWYRSHFASTPARAVAARRGRGPAVTGEASPNYLYDPRVPGRAGALLPQAKIVILLRDPVERAYSHYKERVRAGVEFLSWEEALTAEPYRLAGELDRMSADPLYYSRPMDYYSYRDRGVYRPQVERWLAQYPAESVLIVRSEDLYQEPGRTFLTVTDFLGLRPVPLLDPKRFNYKKAAKMLDQTRAELSAYFEPHNAGLEELLGRSFGWTA
jgi:hypothetical protein